MKVGRICPVCSREYQADTNRLKWGRETTCSRRCSYEFRATKQRKAITLICPICGKEFDRPPSQIKSKHQNIYCSSICHYRGRSLGFTKRIVTKPYNISKSWRERLQKAGKGLAKIRKDQGYRHSEATRAKFSEITANRIARNQFGHISCIEYVVTEELTHLDIKFIHQFVIRDKKGRFAACLDFFLPRHNTAIEVNGTFWHADPRFYDRSNLTLAQGRTIKGYTKKVNLLKELGISLIEIWEADLNESPGDAVANALSSLIN